MYSGLQILHTGPYIKLDNYWRDSTSGDAEILSNYKYTADVIDEF